MTKHLKPRERMASLLLKVKKKVPKCSDCVYLTPVDEIDGEIIYECAMTGRVVPFEHRPRACPYYEPYKTSLEKERRIKEIKEE